MIGSRYAGWLTLLPVYHAVAAVASAGCSPVVRVAGIENWMIKRALDAGAHGIMVPMCETVVREISLLAGWHTFIWLEAD